MNDWITRLTISLALCCSLAQRAGAQQAQPTQPTQATQGTQSTQVTQSTQAAARPAAWADTSQTAPEKKSSTSRKVGIGLLIGSGVAAALAIVFVGLAKQANDSATGNNVYDPAAEDRRNAFQATDTALFAVAGVAFMSGMLFTFVK